MAMINWLVNKFLNILMLFSALKMSGLRIQTLFQFGDQLAIHDLLVKLSWIKIHIEDLHL